MPFDAFMALALYDPISGYYTQNAQQIGHFSSSSDFATSPVISPFFGRALDQQIAQYLSATKTDEVWEFGAGTGALALQVLEALGTQIKRYHIIEVSGALRMRQQQTLAAKPHLAGKVDWLQALPDQLSGVVLGNEVLDAMPIKLLVRKSGVWHERGVQLTPTGYEFSDCATDLRPPFEIAGNHDYLTEIHPQAQAFISTLSDKLRASETGGAALLVDYGFSEQEYYHPQRHMGTLMCHRAHQSSTNPLEHVGQQDITAHVNFTAIALAAQDAGLHINGYTSQGRFLLNCGLLDLLKEASFSEKTMAQKLVTEHEMGELFKVIALSTLEDIDPIGFTQGDRTHTL